MPLPNRNQSISISQLYPDRIRVNYQYSLSNRVPANRIHDALQASGFERVSERLQFRGTFDSSAYGRQITAFVSFALNNSLLNIYVDINPLSDRHRERENFGDERAVDGSENWLHPDDILLDNRQIWERANELTWLNESVANDLAERIVRTLGLSTVSFYRGVAIDRMELTCDFSEACPFAAVQRMQNAFESAFLDTRSNPLRGESSVSTRTENGQRIVHGTWRQGIVFRAYAKTNRRLRIECEVRSQGFRNLRIPRRLDRHDEDFGVLFGIVAGQITEPLDSILSFDRASETQNGSLIEFVLGIGNAFRNSQAARMFIERISIDHSVPSASDRPRLERLLRRGFLERSNRGVYRIASGWRAAANRVRSDLMVFLRAAVR